MFSSADDFIHAIESSGRDEQDVGRIDCNVLAPQFTRVSLRDIDDGAFQKFQHSLCGNIINSSFIHRSTAHHH